MTLGSGSWWCSDVSNRDDIGHLGYHTVGRPREDDIVSVHELVLHRSVTFGSAWVESIDIKWASVWR
jgi:hypothetical protein